MFESYLRDQANRLPDVWNEISNRMQQKDLDELWVKKIYLNHFYFKIVYILMKNRLYQSTCSYPCKYS